MRSEATTPEAYIASLPEDRQQAIATLRKLINKHLPKGYEEAMNWGMISYQIPLTTYPETYNKQPLMYAALASQKNHMSLYMTCMPALGAIREAFEKEYAAAGKKLDMGKGCIRFKKLEDLPLEVIAKYIALVTPEEMIAADKAVHAAN